MEKIYGYQWSEHNKEVNFGDLLTEVLLKAMGIKYVPFDMAPSGSPVCLMVGTTLDLARHQMMTRNNNQLHVWGTGYRANAAYLRDQSISWHAVRGPVTRDALWLTRKIPMGDPALILPMYYDRQYNGKTLCVPHWEARGITPELCTILSPLCQRDAVLDTVMQIAGADFVLAGSLHAAIVAHAYAVPWAFWGSFCERGMESKWSDWLGYLRVGYVDTCHTLREGLVWWERVGRDIPRPSAKVLYEAFPHEAVVGA